ncbi:MAG: coenzyme F420-0:L-glutamate ligase [Candidatus Bathyarchaeota archaeon]|nr:coenzyme F420-0:L-glutamate ligase [Candidatus Bathyarchaeota archaeon]
MPSNSGEKQTLNPVQVIPVEGLPLIEPGDDLAQLIADATNKKGTPLQENDVVVITHVVVSKSEGTIVNLDTITPTEQAIEIAQKTGKDPVMVQLVLDESKDLVRVGPNSIITETKSGIVCANAGVDRSNVLGDRNAVPLPKDPNLSAKKIRKNIKQILGINVAVIVSDTHGRPFRMGEINVAVGASGIKPIRDHRGEKDLFGYSLRIKQTAVADELASAAELVIGQSCEGIPAAIIRGYQYEVEENVTAADLNRPKEKDLFRK